MYEYITHKGYEYKMLILYLLKNMSNDIKGIILDLIEQNLEQEFDYLDIFLNDELEIGSSYYEWFYDSDWYQSD